MSNLKKHKNGRQHSQERLLKETEKKYDTLVEEYQATLDSLEDARTGELLEKHLKNEAYSFLLSEGLLEKFLEFRTTFHRSRHQEALYGLVMKENLGGLWIDRS